MEVLASLCEFLIENGKQHSTKSVYQDISDIMQIFIISSSPCIDFEKVMNVWMPRDVDTLMRNPIVKNSSVIDWGKIMALSNHYIQQNILKILGYKCDITETKNNTPGYDLICEGNLRIQSKIRQVCGKSWNSRQIHFETTRRHCNKNIEKSKSGHVSYSKDEFDFVFLTIIHLRDNFYEKRLEYNLWKFCLIPIKELQDENHDYLITKIPPYLLKKYEIKIEINL